MKKKILSIVLASAMAVTFIPTFAFATEDTIDSESDSSMQAQQEEITVDDVIEQMNDASNDGKISKSEQREIVEGVPVEVMEEYNEVVNEEVEEIMEDNYSDIAMDTTDEYKQTDEYELDCGALLTVENRFELIDEDGGENIAEKLLNRSGLIAYADTQSYGTVKHSQSVTIIGGGTVKLTLVTKIKASNSGLTITDTSASSNSNGLMVDCSRKSKIEKASAGKGATCKSLGGVRYYENLIPYGHTSKTWTKLRCSFKVTSINKSKKKVNFTYTTSKWNSSTW